MQNDSNVGASKPKVIRKTVSLPIEVFQAGEARATADQRDFSNYLAVLISRDVETAKTQKNGN